MFHKSGNYELRGRGNMLASKTQTTVCSLIQNGWDMWTYCALM